VETFRPALPLVTKCRPRLSFLRELTWQERSPVCPVSPACSSLQPRSFPVYIANRNCDFAIVEEPSLSVANDNASSRMCEGEFH
jgi:hypothetical protein